ncbi:MAG: AAA family ATPase, partial [Blastocatellia bacterium]
FNKIEDDLRAIVPSIKRIKARRVQMTLYEKKVISVNETRIPYNEPREVVGDELIFDTTSASEIPAHAMSDGTLLALGVITLMHSPESPRLILLDDVEQGLHPLAQRQLVKTLKEFAEKRDKQILLTSHSGYITDELAPEDVWVMRLDNEGISRCKRLSDHHDAERLLQVLTTGELADAVGEDWVINPPVATGAAND